MLHEIDVESWACDDNNAPLPVAESYKVRLWDGEEFDEKRTLSDPVPTGAQILLAFDRKPVNKYILIALEKGGLKEVSPEETICISARRAERFFAFRSDRTWNFEFDGSRFPWGSEDIAERTLRRVFKVQSNEEIVLSREDVADEKLENGDWVNLGSPELERFYTRKKTWKLLVQGVLITSIEPTIIVREALIQAGIDPDKGWTAALKVSGAPREPVKLTDTIDLTRKGIEKLWLRPNHINNGDAQQESRREFSLREEDERYLHARGISWDAIIEQNQRWFLIRKYCLPDGYKQALVDIAVLIPPTYPAAELDMFFCAPHLELCSGREIPQTSSTQMINGISYQRWSRHRSGDTAWNPNIDSLISHIAIIDASIDREVEN